MARNIGVTFNGKRIIKPGAHSRINADNLGAFGSNSEKKLVFIGSSTGGKPSTYLTFTNSTEAQEVLRGGDLLTAGTLAWAPSNDGIGAGEIGFIRVESAVQASLTKTNLVITSKLYGAEANKIQAKLEDGTIAGSKKLTVYFYQDNKREVYDNIGPVFSVVYTGADATATLTITKDANGKANLLTLTSTSVTASYTLGADGEYKEVNKLIADISDLPGFSATVTAAGNKNLDTAVLDAVATQSVKTTAYTVQAVAGDLANQIQYSTLVTATLNGTMPTNFAYTYLTGGSNGTVPASWATKLDLIAGQGAYIIVPLTKDEAIHAEVARFVESQSANEASEMRAFYGGGLAETIDQTINRSVSLNSPRASVVYPGIVRQVSDGVVETLPPYMGAAIVAGRVAGVAIGEPVTFDSLNIAGVEKVLTSTEIGKLLEGGVTPIESVRTKSRKGFRVSQCITTYQDDANPAYRENSISELIDFLNAELREYLEARYIGSKGTAVTPALIKNDVQSFLDQKIRDEWLVEYDPNSVVVTDGDVIAVQYSAMPVFGINYILITGTFYRSLLSA